jgi:hypothetical protein
MMPKRPDYADSLRDIYLALALIPIAALHTGTYWLKESLERTSRFATEVAATASLARAPLPRAGEAGDLVADVLARDLVEAARAYVGAVVRLPADSGIYFTEELERRRNALLGQIQPDAATDLEGYVDGELERLLAEFDRLSLIVRAEEGRAGRRPSRATGRRKKLGDEITALRATTQGVRDKLKPQRPDTVSLDVPADHRLRALNVYKARTRIKQALREAEALLPAQKGLLAEASALIERHTFKALSTVDRPAKAKKGAQ